MLTFFTRSFAFIKERKSWLWPIALIVLLVVVIFAVRGCSDPQVDWAKQIQDIKTSNQQEIIKIEAAHAKEKADLEAHAKALEDQMKASQVQYEKDKASILKRREISVKDIIDRSGGDPTVIAKKLADLYGFQFVERAQSK